MSRRIAVSPTALALLLPASRSLLRRPYHLSSAFQQSVQAAAPRTRPSYISAPTETSGPLLSRRPDRELPSLKRSYIWLKTVPMFIALIAASALAIFNYQKSSSSTVNSILYALRTNDTSRQMLGDEIYFATKVPWISGELNQLHGKIDISFWVKGNKAKGKVRFVSVRKRRAGFVSFATRTYHNHTDRRRSSKLWSGVCRQKMAKSFICSINLMAKILFKNRTTNKDIFGVASPLLRIISCSLARVSVYKLL
jgi:cytochrome c oxidase assembly factor 1